MAITAKRKKTKQRTTFKVGYAIMEIAWLFLIFLIPLLNGMIRILLLAYGSVYVLLADFSIFGGYIISLGTLQIAKRYGFKKVPKNQDIVSYSGIIKTFAFYSLAVLFIAGPVTSTIYPTSYNSNTSTNNFGLAIGAAALLLYYQYIVEYVSKMF